MSINRTYTRELKENLDYTATWLPNLRLSLGDVGELKNHSFTYRTNLGNLGIPFREGKPGATARYTHTSSEGVRRELKAAGQAPALGSVLAQADAGITFSFRHKDAIVFDAAQCSIRVIDDQEPLKEAILEAYYAGRWDPAYVVVTELVSAQATTIIISEGSSGVYEVKANAGVIPTFEALSVSGSFSLVRDSEIGFNCLAEPGMTPLFRCLGIRRGFFRDAVTTRGAIVRAGAAGAEGGKAAKNAVDEVDYDDFEGGDEAEAA